MKDYYSFFEGGCYCGRHIYTIYLKLRIRKWWRFDKARTVMLKCEMGWVESNNRIFLCTEEAIRDGHYPKYEAIHRSG